MFYAALERFDRDNGERWAGYARWLGRTDLQRVITLDGMLCPPVVHAESSDDWDFVVQEEFMLDFFTDLGFVLQRAAQVRRAQVVAVCREPSAEDVNGFSHPEFEFAGFDIVDTQLVASALLGSNRFPGVFEVSELSAESGLILSHGRAFKIRDQLRRRFPDRKEANCHVWAMWRYLGAVGDGR
jgi:hypothetical protein